MHHNEEELTPYGDERSRVYKASGGSRKNPMLLMVPHPANPTRIQGDRLRHFSDIQEIEARKDGRDIRIDFSNLTVVITGRNLHAVARAIGAHTCSRIEAFDSELRDMPTDSTQPFIETIAFFLPDTGRKKQPQHEPETRAKEDVIT